MMDNYFPRIASGKKKLLPNLFFLIRWTISFAEFFSAMNFNLLFQINDYVIMR